MSVDVLGIMRAFADGGAWVDSDIPDEAYGPDDMAEALAVVIGLIAALKLARSQCQLKGQTHEIIDAAIKAVSA